MRRLLVKAFPNPSIDLLNLLAGSLDKSDAVFSAFVAGIDDVLSDPQSPLDLRRKTLQLALAFVAANGQNSVNAFMLRRDLFTTLARLMYDSATTALAYDAALLIGLLANFRKFEARNVRR
jgi:hypothetical protein